VTAPRLSRRLDWSTTPNPVSLVEASVREAGGVRFDLTSTNPTAVDLGGAGHAHDDAHDRDEDDADDEADDDDRELAAALARARFARYRPTAGGSLAARRLVADAQAPRTGALDPAQLVLTTSSSESYGFLFKLLCDPGDLVLVPQPSYPLFDYLARLEGLGTVPYRLDYAGPAGRGRWDIDLDGIDRCLHEHGPRIRALVVVTPNNPTGSLLRQDALAALDARCAGRGIAIISDEVFGDFVARPHPEHVASVATTRTDSLTFSLGGLSKSCGLPQMKVGWIAVGGPPEARRVALDALELILDTYLPVAAPMEGALGELLRIGQRRRAALVARLATNQRALTSALAPPSPVTALPPDGAEGGWLAILRLPAIQSDEEWVMDLLRTEGLLVSPGYFFDLADDSHVVVSLLTRPTIFAEGLAALARGAARARGAADGPPRAPHGSG
jgi:aspartate/methionine/tyrosine aminotransferase